MQDIPVFEDIAVDMLMPTKLRYEAAELRKATDWFENAGIWDEEEVDKNRKKADALDKRADDFEKLYRKDLE